MQSNIQDRFLLEAALAGDEESFGKLYDKYIDVIYRFIFFRVSGKENAEDLAAEVFMKTWQYVREGDKDIQNFKALLYRIAANRVIDFYRQNNNEYLALGSEAWEQITDQSSLSEETQKKDDLRLVFQAVKVLDPADRELVLMRYTDDLSVKEIAIVLGKSQGAVRTALHRALKLLKTIVKNPNQT